MIRIRTLGSLSVSRDGVALSGAGTQARRLAVLALVARAGSRGITRDRLIALLWPDDDEQASRAALSQALHALRRQLGDDDVFLGVQTLTLNEALATCDVLEFEGALADGDWERAVAAYGGPFLDGFRVSAAPEVDRWIDEERSHLALRHAEAVERLAKNATERGDAPDAVRWWRRRASLDPLNARVTVELMKALDRAGERAAALQQARIYEALIDQELSIPPDQEVVRYAEALRSGTVPVPVRAPAVVTESSPTVAPIEPTSAPTTIEGASRPAAADPLPRAGRFSRRPVAIIAALILIAVVGGIAAIANRRPSSDAAGPVLAVGEITDRRAAADGQAFPAAEMLTSNLARVSGFQVLSRIRLLELLDRRSTGDRSDERVAAAAREAGATELLEGGVHAIADGKLLLDLRRVDLRSGKLLTAYRLEGGDLFELIDQATSEVASSFGRAPPPARGKSDTHSLVAYRFYEEGLTRYAAGDFRTARGLFDAALREDTLFAMAAFYRLRSGAPIGVGAEPGEVDRLRALAAVASDRERLLILGTLAAGTLAPELVALADTFVVRYPAEVDGYQLAGIARLDRGELTEAIPYLHRVLTLDSASIGSGRGRCLACEAVLGLTYAYQALDSLSRAESLLEDWARRDTSSTVPSTTLSGILIAAGRFDEAMATRRRASANQRDVLEGLFPATVRIHAGDFASADQTLRQLMGDAATPDVRAEVSWLLSLSLRNQERWNEAIELGRSTLRALPAERRKDYGLSVKLVEGQSLFESGKFPAAARLWDSLARNPDPRQSEGERYRRVALQYALVAEASYEAGNRTELMRAADSVRAWAERSGNPRTHRLIEHVNGLVALARNDSIAASESFRRAIWSPTLGFTRSNYRLAELLMARKQPAEAASLLGSALRGTLEGQNLYITHTALHELLARAYASLGRSDSAAVHRRFVESARRGVR